MKKIIFLLLFIPFGLSGQINPYAGVEYFSDYEYIYNKSYDLGVLTLINKKPSGLVLNVIMGVEFKIIKNLSVDFKTETLVNKINGMKFTPMQSSYYAVLKYEYKQFEVRYEHFCVHPMKTIGYVGFNNYGSHDKIGIYWKLKK